MAEEPKATVPELERAEIPWVVAYLREDIQDLRGEIREVRRSVERLDDKIDEARREMSVQFRWMVATMVAVGGLIVAALKLLPGGG